jgi:hypothetical protein
MVLGSNLYGRLIADTNRIIFTLIFLQFTTKVYKCEIVTI